jgi:hypothetical protein
MPHLKVGHFFGQIATWQFIRAEAASRLALTNTSGCVSTNPAHIVGGT